MLDVLVNGVTYTWYGGACLYKAARQKMQVGATKEKDGKKYVLNENRRWTRVREQTQANTQAKKPPGQSKPLPERKAETVRRGQSEKREATAKPTSVDAPQRKIDLMMTNIVDVDSIAGAESPDPKLVAQIVKDIKVLGTPPFSIPIVREGLEEFRVANHPSAIALVAAVKQLSDAGLSPDRLTASIFKSDNEAQLMAKYLPNLNKNGC